jgi:pimeloyl-ACP methyl ester carboxylesterase
MILRVFTGLMLFFSISIVPQVAPPNPYFVDQAKLPFQASPGTTTSRYWGVKDNAGYRIEVPQNWNGELVLYAHGFRGGGAELTITNPAIRSYLIQQGFAWAASSYSRNGYDVKVGVEDSYALIEVFTGLVSKPNSVYMTGHSMGGHVTGVTIERYPNAFVGALPMCGVMGDVELFDFFLNYNLVAQSLAGMQAQFPFPDNYFPAVVPRVSRGLGYVNFPTTTYVAAMNGQGQKLREVVKHLSGGERPFFNHAFGNWANFLFTVGGGDGSAGIASGNVTTNMDTIYQLDGDPAVSPTEQELNNAVLRVRADPQARQSIDLSNIPTISGNLPFPVLSMHTIGDLFVPFSMEQIYARRVAAQGKADWLVTRAYRDVGHCAFTVEEQEEAFKDLVNWVKNGVKPGGDQILDAPVVADPNFGCNYTRSFANRLYAYCNN